MLRRGRRSAGADVLVRARRLSDELLHVEESAFAAIEAVAADVTPRMARMLHGDPLLLTHDVPSQFGRIAHATVLAVMPIVEELLTTSAEMAIESITEELEHCVATLAVKHRGAPRRGAVAATMRTQSLVDQLMQAFGQSAAYGVGRFPQIVSEQLGLASLRDEPYETVVARMLSTEPLNLPGIGGRGVWWQLVSTWPAYARAASISIVNASRQQAMVTVNGAIGG